MDTAVAACRSRLPQIESGARHRLAVGVAHHTTHPHTRRFADRTSTHTHVCDPSKQTRTVGVERCEGLVNKKAEAIAPPEHDDRASSDRYKYSGFSGNTSHTVRLCGELGL
jgi:hypothetical protein